MTPARRTKFHRDTWAWQRRYLLAALAHYGGNVTRAAFALGFETTHGLQYALRSRGITAADVAAIRAAAQTGRAA